MMDTQLPFRFGDPRGGRRDGAGRKPKNDKAGVSHRARPVFEKAMPVHVTLRIRDDVPSLRASRRFAAIRRSFAAARGRNGMRLVEFSVLSNHLHLVVEADSSQRLSRGMQGLAIRLAKALNAVLRGRTGSVFADHFHSRLLRTPTELTRALRYVADNAEHHYGEADASFSSRAAENIALLAAPVGWLLRVGWRRSRDRGARPPTATGLLQPP
jgi:putative transposase